MHEHDTELTMLARDLVLAMMRSASTDHISPMDWWPRAKTALETGASTARSWPQLISRMCKKLQIDTLHNRSASSVSSIGERVEELGLQQFRAIARRDAVYIVAMAQVERQEQRARFKTTGVSDDNTPDMTMDEAEELF